MAFVIARPAAASIRLLLAVTLLAVVGCESVDSLSFGLGEREIKRRQVKEIAQGWLDGKHDPESIHVSIQYSGRNSRISGYQVSVRVKGCENILDLFYDEAMVLRSVNDKLEC